MCKFWQMRVRGARRSLDSRRLCWIGCPFDKKQHFVVNDGLY